MSGRRWVKVHGRDTWELHVNERLRGRVQHQDGIYCAEAFVLGDFYDLGVFFDLETAQTQVEAER